MWSKAEYEIRAMHSTYCYILKTGSTPSKLEPYIRVYREVRSRPPAPPADRLEPPAYPSVKYNESFKS